MLKFDYIAEVCEIREGRTCKDCIYYGKRCEAIKKYYHVKKPKELLEMATVFFTDLRKEKKKGNKKNGN